MSKFDNVVNRVMVVGMAVVPGILLALPSGLYLLSVIYPDPLLHNPRWETDWTWVAGVLGLVLGCATVAAGLRIVKRRRGGAAPGGGIKLLVLGYLTYWAGAFLYWLAAAWDSLTCPGFGFGMEMSCARGSHYVPAFSALVGGPLLGLAGAVWVFLALSRPAPAHGRPAVS